MQSYYDNAIPAGSYYTYSYFKRSMIYIHTHNMYRIFLNPNFQIFFYFDVSMLLKNILLPETK